MLVNLVFASAFLTHGACATESANTKQEQDTGSSFRSSPLAGGGVLVTTGFWVVKSKQGSEEESLHYYVKRMSAVMGLNASMMLYGDAVGLSHMVETRKGRALPLVGQEEVPVGKLPPCSTHQQEFDSASGWTHPVHVPSTELGCVWSGKTSLLRRSAELYPEFDWYMWLDAGLHDRSVYSYVRAFSPEKVEALPKDAVIVAESQDRCETCKSWDDYCHCVSGMAFIVPRALVSRLAALFTEYQESCLRERPSWICLSDQVIMTRVRNDFPDMFFSVGSNYGAVAGVMLAYDATPTSAWPAWLLQLLVLPALALFFLTLRMGPSLARLSRQLLSGLQKNAPSSPVAVRGYLGQRRDG